MTMILVLIGIILGSVGLDQLTKLLAVQYLKPIGSYPLWQNVLHLTYVENRGAAFGMLSNQRWVFMIFSTVAIIGLVVYLFRFCKEGKWIKVALAMIIGGGIGNMIDRIALGYVVDFVDFTLIHFAVFNVADSFVSVGAVMLVIWFVRSMVTEYRNGKKKKAFGVFNVLFCRAAHGASGAVRLWRQEILFHKPFDNA